MKHSIKTFSLGLLTLSFLYGCNNSDDATSQSATLNVGVIDQISTNTFTTASYNLDEPYNPHDKYIDDIDQAVIAFNYVFLKPIKVNGQTCDQTGECEAYHIDFNDEQNALRMIDVKNSNGISASSLFQGLSVKPGEYTMCLYMNGQYENGTQVDISQDSYVKDVDGSYSYLSTPSQGSCAGAKPPEDAGNTGRLTSKPFTILSGENNLAVMFDLETNLKYNKNHDWRFLGGKQFDIIRVDDAVNDIGHIQGSVDIDYVAYQCEREPFGDSLDSVYLYKFATYQEQMSGFYSLDGGEEGKKRPLKRTPIIQNSIEQSGGQASFSFMDLPAGIYALGYSCTAENDSEEIQGIGFHIHDAKKSVSVSPGKTTQVQFL